MKRRIFCSAHRQGLSLLELAIVLGVVGLISGAIWVAAAKSRQNQRISDAVALVNEIATNVRGVYTGFRNATPPSTVAAQIAANLYPQSVVNAAGTGTLGPWDNAISIIFPAATPITGFTVQFNLPTSISAADRRQICIDMVTRMGATATNYSGGYVSGVLPSATVPIDGGQGNAPSLAFVFRSGVWVDVTGAIAASGTANSIFTGGTQSCAAFAFYYRL